VSTILGKPAIKDAEEKLAKAFILFRHVAIDLNDSIAVSDAVLAVQPSIKPKKKRKSTEGDKTRKEVLKLFSEGVRQKDIASRVHVSESRVSQILNESRPKKL
jgi:DNA-binding NarL/FixJ family response regulator